MNFLKNSYTLGVLIVVAELIVNNILIFTNSNLPHVSGILLALIAGGLTILTAVFIVVALWRVFGKSVWVAVVNDNLPLEIGKTVGLDFVGFSYEPQVSGMPASGTVHSIVQ